MWVTRRTGAVVPFQAREQRSPPDQQADRDGESDRYGDDEFEHRIVA
jgi:hypothetical protein